MTDKSTQPVQRKATPSNAPFRLVFHIGTGKTGTSSIQQTLGTQKDVLKKRGFWYLGMNLEHAPGKHYPWQKTGGIHEFLKLGRDDAYAQALSVLSGAVPAIQRAGCSTAIWSNEWFFRRPTAVIDVVDELRKAGIDVQIVVYVRRHDAWARSAYIQWGLKAKTYKGPLRPFNKWIKQNRVEFAGHLRLWQERFPDRCVVRNLDAVGDAVGDFLKVVGIGEEGLEKLRVNETPSPEELVLRTLFNEQVEDKVPIIEFTRMLTKKEIGFDRPVDRILDTLLPTEEDLKQVAADCAEDRHAVNTILAECGQPPIFETPFTTKPMAVDVAKVTTAVFQIVIQQSKRIQQLETRMENMIPAVGISETGKPFGAPTARSEKEPAGPDDLPVFAISPGRSGSTLAQRVLNCHPDLVLWGEHHGFLNGFAGAHELMRNPRQVKFPQTARDNKGPQLLLPTLSDPAAPLEWANPWSLEEFEVKVRTFLRDYFGSRLAEGQRWGFKEIRYNNMPVLNMLRVLYPQGKFVFIGRDPIEVTRSKVFAFIKESKWQELNEARRRQRVEGMLKEVREHYEVYETFMKHHPGAGLIVEYETLVASPREVIAATLDHLALDPARYDWALAEQVMESVITRTKRDETLVEFIRQVDASLGSEQS